ncbi:IS3 family transposase, partial [Corynebacterium sp. NML130628]|uniref:IS3 family transposase n=1 Tax=Corynebacterium sp. NML130628 TaxID=1906333 RepID=UPI000AA70BD1
DERDRQKVKDAIIEVLMGGQAQGKVSVRDGVLTTAAKAAVVVAITDAHGVSIKKACQLVGIAESTFYHHQGKHQRVLARRTARREQYKPLIMQAVAESNQSYGYRRIHAWLKAQGHRISEKIVRELMDELACRPPAKQSTKYSSYTGETAHSPANLLLVKPRTTCQCHDNAQPVPDVIELSEYFRTHADAEGLTHDFHADRPWEKIGTDVTEIHCPDGKLYLSAAIDFFDGMPIAVTMSTSPNHDLVADMINRIDVLKPDGVRPILHSDRGGLYRSTKWVGLITDHTHNNLDCPACQADTWCRARWRYIPSLSRKGTSGDNARTEGFFGTMKQELLKGRAHTSQMTVAQMREYIESYIDFYINTRLKSTLGDGYTTIAEHRQALSA